MVTFKVSKKVNNTRFQHLLKRAILNCFDCNLHCNIVVSCFCYPYRKGVKIRSYTCTGGVASLLNLPTPYPPSHPMSPSEMTKYGVIV